MDEAEGYFDLLRAMLTQAQRDATQTKDAATGREAISWLYGEGCDLFVQVCKVSDEAWYSHVDELMEKAA